MPELRTTRKFKPSSAFRSSERGYFLLPFRFHRINDEKEVLINEVGDFLICPSGTAHKVVDRSISQNSLLYADLISNFFISEKPVPDLIDILATRYRSKKAFLDQFTALHIFVVTLRCDHSCHYCQVSRKTQNKVDFDMSTADIDKSINLMFKTPSRSITMEFQGGEPLLAFDKVQYAVLRAKELNKSFEKKISFVICTNLTNITDEMLDFCKQHDILLSTSFDGPQFLHDKNRPKSGAASYDLFVAKLEKSRKALGHDRVSALMTTTKLSLEHPIEIIDSYLEHGFSSIFLRPISPYGFALKNEKKNRYETEKFLDFYKTGLQYILQLNDQGTFIIEEYASIILRKLLTPFSVGYVDLQSPAGAINSVIVYNYDGYVYASDEARMLAENNDFTFRLGHVASDSYQELFYGEKAKKIAEVWANESLPGCSECGFQSICGADPVHNHATQGDPVGYRPTNSFCKRNMEIIRFLIELLNNKSLNAEKIFRSWLTINERSQ